MDDVDKIEVASSEVVTDDPAKLASDPLPPPEGSPPLEPKVTVEIPIEAGSRSLIGGDAKLKYPRTLATIGGRNPKGLRV